MRQAVCLILVLFLASCASVPTANRERMEDDIREAVFRYQFDTWKRPGAVAYYLDVTGNDTDPSDEFMKRFAMHSPLVKKCSKGKVNHLGQGVFDADNGGRGVIFRAGSISWVTSSDVTVSGGFYENGQSTTGNTYTVCLIHGRWHVVQEHEEWIGRTENLELNHDLCSI